MDYQEAIQQVFKYLVSLSVAHNNQHIGNSVHHSASLAVAVDYLLLPRSQIW